MNLPQVYFRLFGDSSTDEDRGSRHLLEPSLMNRFPIFSPGSLLNCEYRIELRPESAVTAVETSVVWLTHGKGDEDLGVHFFERRENKMVQPEVLRQTHKLSTMLPRSPLSYAGEIVKVDWCVRVRIFMNDGSQITKDCLFKLGNVSSPEMVASDNDDEQDADATASSAEIANPSA